MRRLVLLLICAVMVSGLLAGCTPKSTEPPNGEDPTPPPVKNMILATGGVAGTYYPLGGAIAQAWSTKVSGLNVTAQATGASVENLKLLDKKEVDLAFTQNDIVEYAVKGIESFKDNPLSSALGVASIYPEVIQIIVGEKSPVQSIQDVKGLRVSVGAPGSGNEANARQILTTFGITYDDVEEQFLSYAESVEQFKDGHLDVIMLTTGAPNSGVQDLAVTNKIRVVPLSAEETTAIQEKFPFLASYTLPANTYQGQTNEVPTVCVLACLVAHKDLAEDLVYNMTKTLWENRDSIGEANAKAKMMDEKDPLKGITVKAHPGALKYYKEKGWVK